MLIPKQRGFLNARRRRQAVAAARLKAPGMLGHPPARVFSSQIEVGDELEIIPAFAIALSGCNMRCSFCITGRESWDARRGRRYGAKELAGQAAAALETGKAKTVLILGGEPTLSLPWLLRFAAHLPDQAPLVLKTNGLCGLEKRKLLSRLIDLWLVDLKFGNDLCATALARSPGYLATVRATLLWAASTSDLIVRHLLLPGHLECCWRPIAAWLCRYLPEAKVSLRFGYWPAWQAQWQPGMDRPISPDEQECALRIAAEFHLNLIR